MRTFFTALVCVTTLFACDKGRALPKPSPPPKVSQQAALGKTQVPEAKPLTHKQPKDSPTTVHARSPEVSTKQQSKTRWVHGVKHLPVGHPCHDLSEIDVHHEYFKDYYHDDDDDFIIGEPTDTTQVMGAYRALCKKGERCGINARLSKGVFWSTAAGAFSLSTCSFSGHNVVRKTCPSPEECAPMMSDESTWHVEHLPEANDRAYSAVTLMHKPSKASTWHVVSDDIMLHWGDGECCPSFAFAQAELLTVEDSDSDDVMESTYVEMTPCHHAAGFKETQELCEPHSNTDEVFAFAVYVREGIYARRSHVLVDTKGKVLARDKAIYLGSPSPQKSLHLTRIHQQKRASLLAKIKALARTYRPIFPQP